MTHCVYIGCWVHLNKTFRTYGNPIQTRCEWYQLGWPAGAWKQHSPDDCGRGTDVVECGAAWGEAQIYVYPSVCTYVCVRTYTMPDTSFVFQWNFWLRHFWRIEKQTVYMYICSYIYPMTISKKKKKTITSLPNLLSSSKVTRYDTFSHPFPF